MEFEKKFREMLERMGVEKLYPPQKESIEKIMQGRSLVVSIPTASGKTLIAYAAILRALSLKMKAIYVVPLRALAVEKYDELQDLLGDEYKIMLSMGDYDSPAKELKEADVVVAVYEKIDSILRHDPDYLYSVGVMVVDEIHMLQDVERGPTLEMVLTRMKFIKNSLQLVALSATIKNYREIAEWLDADFVYSEFRPVPLRIGIYHDGMLEFQDGDMEFVKEDKLRIGNLVRRSLENGGQVLIFVNRRSYAESLAEKLRDITMDYTEEFELPRSIDEEKNIYDDKIIENARHGVCFHHAGLSNAQRRFVETKFKERKIKCLVATPTLAAGVNLPARTVIVRDITRYSEEGSVPIPAFEIKQMLGRAGRPRYDVYGEGIVVSRKGYVDFDELLEIDDITSRLDNMNAFRIHMLGIIASEIVDDEEGLLKFFENTFLYHRGYADLKYLVKDTLSFLEDEELVTTFRKLRTTKFGKMVSDLYLDPLTGISFRNSFSLPYSDLYALYVISSSSEMIPLSSRDEDFPVPDHPGFQEMDGDAYKTALMLSDWADEEDINDIITKYGIGPGDVHMRVEIADWLLYSYSRIAYMLNSPHAPKIEILWKRVKYGVRPELLDLIELRGVGRVRARRLYNFGYRTIEDIANADPEKIAKIPGIGEKISLSIVEEANLLRSRKKIFKYRML
ncbi:MAG: DEAD/DEAH box helicase [Thermoplasmata archaeon]